MESMLCGVKAQQQAAELYPVEDYLKARADRAIAASLLHTGALLVARRESLHLRRQTLHIQATHVRASDPESVHCLGRLAADYYRAHGHLVQIAKRLGQRLDRHSAKVIKLA